MKIPVKKLECGFEMPIFGLGTWLMGGDKARQPDNDDQKDIEAIKRAIDNGITHIDTAQNYAEGWVEKLVGQAIQGYERAKLFLVVKIARTNLGYDDVLSSFEESLKRLNTDYADLVLIHAPNPEIPIQKTIKAMDRLKTERMTREIGVSNFSSDRFDRAQHYSQHKIVANQLHLNLIYREAEQKGLIDYCQKNDIMFIAWRPLQRGVLSKKGIPVLDQVCQKYQKTPAQISLNWLISQKNIVTLSKMHSKKHLQENLGALSYQMTKEDVELLRKEFPNQESISDAVPLI